MDMALYGYHDSSVCIRDDNGKYHIYEAERFFGKRYALLTQVFKDAYNVGHLTPTDEQFFDFFDYITNKHQIKNIENFYYHDIYPDDLRKIEKFFKIKNYQSYEHHYAHACSTFYQSGFRESHIITYDGAGKNLDGTLSSFVYWKASNDGIKKIKDFSPYNSEDGGNCHFSLGNCYLDLSSCLSSIKSTSNFGLPRAGKLMGLCSYGKVRDEWKAAVERFYDNNKWDYLNTISDELNMPINKMEILKGQEELDFAATNQWGFENKFFKIFSQLNIPHGSNLCLSGGCALNIIVNQKLFEMGYNVYIPPNVGDCGLTFGILADLYKDYGTDITYAGFDILDKDYVDNKFACSLVSDDDLANILYKHKKIIGFVHGSSECGPRALGNRSILCYPDISNLKDKLNSEIKFREWFRPFGAITKLDCVERYFENGCESPYMNFCPTLKPEYRWPSITHVDNTCRIQTITEKQHPKLYSVLTEIEKIGGEPILLNTSFNIKGKPILTRLKDAFDCLHQTKLDGFVYEDKFYQNL